MATLLDQGYSYVQPGVVSTPLSAYTFPTTYGTPAAVQYQPSSGVGYTAAGPVTYASAGYGAPTTVTYAAPAATGYSPVAYATPAAPAQGYEVPTGAVTYTTSPAEAQPVTYAAPTYATSTYAAPTYSAQAYATPTYATPVTYTPGYGGAAQQEVQYVLQQQPAATTVYEAPAAYTTPAVYDASQGLYTAAAPSYALSSPYAAMYQSGDLATLQQPPSMVAMSNGSYMLQPAGSMVVTPQFQFYAQDTGVTDQVIQNIRNIGGFQGAPPSNPGMEPQAPLQPPAAAAGQRHASESSKVKASSSKKITASKKKSRGACC